MENVLISLNGICNADPKTVTTMSWKIVEFNLDIFNVQ